MGELCLGWFYNMCSHVAPRWDLVLSWTMQMRNAVIKFTFSSAVLHGACEMTPSDK